MNLKFSEEQYYISIILWYRNVIVFIGPRITTSVWPPKQTHAKDGCGSKECYKGIFPDVFHAIQSELNFTYTIETTNNGGGTRLKNGTWIGQIGFS